MAQADDPLVSTPVEPAPGPPPPSLPAPVGPDSASLATPAGPPAPPPAGLWGLVLTAVAVLASGLGIAFVIERYLASPRVANPGAVVTTSGATDVSTRTQVDPGGGDTLETRHRDNSDRLEKLTRQVEALQKRLEAQSGPGPQPEVAALQVRVADLTETSNKLVPLLSKLDHLDNRVNDLASSVAALRNDPASPQPRTTTVSPGPAPGSTPREARPAEAVPPSTTPTPLPDTRRPTPAPPASPLADPKSLSTVADLFRRAKYKDARDALNALTVRYPADARAWYYAALCLGFTTRDWSVGAARLAEKGVAREEAGTPRTPDIDAEFKDLNPSNGKDWLSAYRKRVKARKPAN